MVKPMSSLRCNYRHLGDGEASVGQHYNEELREAVAAAIKRYPNTEAEWWIGPEAVLHEVEKFLEYNEATNREWEILCQYAAAVVAVAEGFNSIPDEARRLLRRMAP